MSSKSAEPDLSPYRRFEKMMKALVAVPKKELQEKLDKFKKEKPKRKSAFR